MLPTLGPAYQDSFAVLFWIDGSAGAGAFLLSAGSGSSPTCEVPPAVSSSCCVTDGSNRCRGWGIRAVVQRDAHQHLSRRAAETGLWKRTVDWTGLGNLSR